MANKIEINTTKRVAELARLELTDEELKLFTENLANIIGYIEKLAEVNVDGVEPMVHPIPLSMPLREDEVEIFEKAKDGTPKILEHAPDVLYEGFKVPPIL